MHRCIGLRAEGTGRMGETWRNGWKVLVQSLGVFKKYPKLLVPILGAWAVYAPSVIFMRYGYDGESSGLRADLSLVFLIILLLSFSVLFSCAIVLDMIRQIEAGEPSLLRAFFRRLGRDLPRIFLLSVGWAIIWFALTVLDAILSKKDRDNSDDALTAQNAAETIANYKSFSFSSAFIEALEKGVRMVMFLIMPGIVWENLDVFAATKKGLAVLRAHLRDFGSGYALTYAASSIIFLPPAIIFELGTGRHGRPPPIHFPDSVWVGVIIYMGFAWSLSIYLEQMFMAQLYLWHMKWEEQARAAAEANLDPPSFYSVERPQLLAGAPDPFTE